MFWQKSEEASSTGRHMTLIARHTAKTSQPLYFFLKIAQSREGLKIFACINEQYTSLIAISARCKSRRRVQCMSSMPEEEIAV